MFLGAVIRLWALGFISGKKNQRIVQEGPYRLTRNPLYFGSFVFGIGMCLLGGSFTAAFVFLAFFAVVYGAAMRIEERELEIMFGEEFRRYRLAVPLFFPQFASPLPEGEAVFHIRRYGHEMAAVIFLFASAYAVTEWMAHLHACYGLPGWFD